MDRRRFLGTGAAWLAGAALAGGRTGSSIATIETGLGGRVGVMAIDTLDGSEISHRADERFAMCSTFKWALAALVLFEVDRQQISLEERLAYGREDLLDYAPVAQANLQAGSLSVKDLAQAIVTVSDNTAANLLLKRVGGPAALTAFLRRCGDNVTRLDRYEPELNTNIFGDERDTTTPRAMAETMKTILTDDWLSPASRNRLIHWLKSTTTGLNRLRAGLPAGWVAGDKTGTGVNGAANDIAIAWPPGRPPIVIAAYLSESGAEPAALDAAHAAIASTVARHIA